MVAKHTASRSEQAVSNRISRVYRPTVEEMPNAADLTRKKCTKEKPCLRWIVNVESATPTDMALTVLDHPLAGFFRLVNYDDGQITEKLTALLGNERHIPVGVALGKALERYGLLYPINYMVILESVDLGRSQRDIAAEMSLSQPTAGAVLQHALDLLVETMRTG